MTVYLYTFDYEIHRLGKQGTSSITPFTVKLCPT